MMAKLIAALSAVFLVVAANLYISKFAFPDAPAVVVGFAWLPAKSTAAAARNEAEGEEPHTNLMQVPLPLEGGDYLSRFRRNFAHQSANGAVRRPILSYVHIPKTGGTTIEALSGRVWELTSKAAKSSGHPMPKQKGPILVHWGVCIFQNHPFCPLGGGGAQPHGRSRRTDLRHSSPHINRWKVSNIGWWHQPRYLFPMANVDPYLNSISFASVRRVYDIFPSDFYFRCNGPKLREKYPDAARACNSFPPRNSTARAEMVRHFNGFIRAETDDMRHDRRWAMGHLLPQSWFVLEPSTEVRVVDHVLHLERLPEEFPRLMAAYGFPEIRLDDVSPQMVGTKKSEDAKLSSDDINAESLRKINRLWADDFLYFGYDMVVDPKTG